MWKDLKRDLRKLWQLICDLLGIHPHRPSAIMRLSTIRELGIGGITTIAARRATLRLVAATHPELTIVQIGGHTGPSGSDPLWRFFRTYFDPTKPTFRPSYRAIIVEPVGEFFVQLAANYAPYPNIQCEQVAITSTSGVMPFYRLGVNPRDYGMPEWYDQLGSLSPARVDAIDDEAGRAFLRRHQIVEHVRCVTLAELLEQHGIEQLDILQIDAEGAEWDILRSIDFRAIRPRLVNYERVLLGEHEKPCRSMLRDAGYCLVDWQLDTLAVRFTQQSRAHSSHAEVHA
jgi:FkbM family methyltransferase